MFKLKLLAYGLAAVGLFLAGWKVNGWRLEQAIQEERVMAYDRALSETSAAYERLLDQERTQRLAAEKAALKASQEAAQAHTERDESQAGILEAVTDDEGSRDWVAECIPERIRDGVRGLSSQTCDGQSPTS